ncbi:hypothetical protein LJC64_04045 [Ruminococcaceae bacterium OttesenSCG-928-A11]|nr:hypothetical protein [Ruminococcaceae bacterium OttesenSCG-928-A11]
MAEHSKRGQGRWHRLDNTANLFPVITSKRGSNVYRMTIDLTEPVAPELLQQALEKTLPWFDAFRVRMRHGLFWFYLDANENRPLVREEEDYPCQTINPDQNDEFLFKVTYYAHKINLEVYHVLSDGAGALQFFQALCCQYLMLAHPAAFSPEDKQRHWFAEHAANTEDGYVENYTPTKKTTFKMGRGYRLRGERDVLGKLSVIHAHIPIKEILAFCRAREVSLSQYLTAVIGWAVYTQQLKQKPPSHPVNIFLPVNLRSLFESNTTLNFFSNVYISLKYDQQPMTFDTLLAEVKRQFEEKISRQSMLEKISYTVGSGYSLLVRAVPLPLKNFALRLIYEQSAKSSTLGFSNVGIVKFPAPFEDYVRGAAVLLSTTQREPFKCAAFSCKGFLTLTFTSTLKSVGLQRAAIRQLAADGLPVTIESNGVDYASL